MEKLLFNEIEDLFFIPKLVLLMLEEELTKKRVKKMPTKKNERVRLRKFIKR
jgi:hypothetical protein